MPDTIGYLGPAGTFCEEAARRYKGQGKENLMPYRSIREVFGAVEKGDVKSGIVPIENTYEGPVNQTLDLMTGEHNVRISGEIIIPIQQNLLTHPGVSKREIDCILSHPQALAQCREYLNAHYAGVALLEVPSTAEAARLVATSAETWAAIATRAAAEAYGLQILAADIQDQSNNATRFVVLSSEDGCYVPGCKTSLLIYVLDRPGALFKVLQEFYERDINLCKIESRPTRTRMGDYLFFIDIEGHRHEDRVEQALTAVAALAAVVRVLGSYPAAPALSGNDYPH